MSLQRTLPAPSAPGTVVTLRHQLSAARPSSGTVDLRCPLPAGGSPAEDGWTLKERLPEGARVTLADAAVLVLLEEVPPEGLTVDIPVRLQHRGHWVLPAATAQGASPADPWAHSPGGMVEVR